MALSKLGRRRGTGRKSHVMTLAREQAIQVMKSRNLDIHSSELTGTHIIDIVALGRRLEPRERQLILTELATRAWLRPRPFEGPLYPEFEEVLWTYLSKEEGVEEKVIASLGTSRADPGIEKLYNEYLKGMFASSGKARLDFYKDMLTEAGIEMGLEDAEFGDEALNFFAKVANSVHKEHLLVFYSAGLVAKLAIERDPSKCNPWSEEWLDAVCRYFENGLPLEDQFIHYSKDCAFLKRSLEEGRLSKIK